MYRNKAEAKLSNKIRTMAKKNDKTTTYEFCLAGDWQYSLVILFSHGSVHAFIFVFLYIPFTSPYSLKNEALW